MHAHMSQCAYVHKQYDDDKRAHALFGMMCACICCRCLSFYKRRKYATRRIGKGCKWHPLHPLYHNIIDRNFYICPIPNGAYS